MYFNCNAQIITAYDRMDEPEVSKEECQNLLKFWSSLLPQWPLRADTHTSILQKNIYPIKFALSLKERAEMSLAI